MKQQDCVTTSGGLVYFESKCVKYSELTEVEDNSDWI